MTLSAELPVWPELTVLQNLPCGRAYDRVGYCSLYMTFDKPNSPVRHINMLESTLLLRQCNAHATWSMYIDGYQCQPIYLPHRYSSLCN